MQNPYGLRTSFFELEDDELVGIFTPAHVHQSYPGRLHGGITTALLDETIGRAIMTRHDDSIWGVTIEFTVKFKKPIPLDQELRVVGRVTEESSRFFEGSGELLLPGGDIAATGFGKYMKLPIEKIADFDVSDQEWKVVKGPNDPEFVEI